MHRLIDAIKSGDAELIEQQLGFCKGWGGGPLAAAALVAEAWLAERGAGQIPVAEGPPPNGGGSTRRAKPSSSKGSGGKSRCNPQQWDEAPSSLPPISG